MTLEHILGMSLALLAIVVLSICTGKAAKKSKGANSFVVAGAIMGTLVGGSSTVGTAQLAYVYGMSAWWFTLGSGIACLVLALFYVKPLRQTGEKTLIAITRNEFGDATGLVASVLSSLGSFINIISQLIAATAIIAVVVPDMSIVPALVISAAFMAVYVIFGGTKGSGMVGILKMLLLYAAMMVSGVLALSMSGGATGFLELVRGIANPENIKFHSLFARGIGTDMGACLSLILGVITTQSYAQALFAAERTDQAVKGALLSAFLIPPVGIGGILVGLYMRATHPGIIAKTALTLFVTENLPPFFGGIVLGALFIAVVGTGAGLALGIATVVKRDIIGRFSPQNRVLRKVSERLLIVILLCGATVLSMGPLGDTILNFAFMSMGLRGATIFVPLCCALWMKNKISGKYALASVIAGPVVVLIFGLIDILPFDPLFVGVIASCLIMLAGFVRGKKSLANLSEM